MADTSKAGAQRRKAAPRGRTAAAVDKDLKAFKNEVTDRFDGLDGALANIANLLSDKRAQELNDNVQDSVQYDEEPARQVGEVTLPQQQYEEDFEVEYGDDEYEDDYDDEPEAVVDPRDYEQRGYAKPRRRGGRKPVGERPGDKIIRNIHNHPLRLRLGKPSDPYRVNLEAAGTPGDCDQIPASLTGDLGYKRNLNRSFEEISLDEFNALQEIYAGYSTGGYEGGYTDAQLVRDEDRTIYDSAQGGRIDRNDGYDTRDPRTWPGYRGGGVGPRFSSDFAGADPQVTAAARHALGQDDFDADEAAEFEDIRRRASGMLPPDPNDPSGRAAIGKLRRRANAKRQRQLAGQDRESQAMAQRIAHLEQGGRAGKSKQGIIPEGELNLPVRLVRGQEVTVAGGNYQGPGRRLPTENVPPVPRRRG